MTFVQATTGSGGWPMSVWLTPALEPFYGGTYFPPTSRWGRPGFVEILEELARAWREDRDAHRVVGLDDPGAPAQLRPVGRAATPCRGPTALDACRGRVRRGVRPAPRRVRQRAEVPAAVRAAVPAARARPHGHRRAAGHDAGARCGRWRLAGCATTSAAASTATAWTATGGCRTSRRCSTTRRSWCWPISRPRRPPATRSTPTWPSTRSPTCGATSRIRRAGSTRPRTPTACRPSTPTTPQPAQDGGRVLRLGRARSCAGTLGADAEAFCQRFGVRPDGNAPFDPQNEFTGKNLLYTAKGARRHCGEHSGVSEAEVEAALARSRGVLLDVRGTASAAAPRRQGADRVERADDCGLCPGRPGGAGRRGVHRRGACAPRAFLERHLWDPATRTLLRRYRNGDAARGGLRRGLRLSDLRAARALPGDRRSALARVGAGPAAPHRRAVLGPGRRRVVQHDGRRPDRCCCASRKPTTAPSRPPARSRC